MRGWYIPFCMLNVIICTTYFRKDSFRAWTTTKTCILLNVLIEIAKLYRFDTIKCPAILKYSFMQCQSIEMICCIYFTNLIKNFIQATWMKWIICLFLHVVFIYDVFIPFLQYTYMWIVISATIESWDIRALKLYWLKWRKRY
jgi:hypothetical protein